MNIVQRTVSNTVSRETPGLARLQSIEDEIQELRAQQATTLESIVRNAEFMDIPVRVVPWFGIEQRDETLRTIGTTWHLISQFSERENYTGWMVHLAESCDGRGWCSVVDSPQRNKYERAGSRFWHTFHGPHILVGAQYGARDSREYVFIPTTSSPDEDA
ncbi:hypothetical protein SAMN06295879_1011 [Agreia bicolorata]|uniref:Uncharacterized protein n=1 Tax=Agreia bicolorata TaxID=110935 RepID=A0A1T4XBS3_9MICO|nr:hypothetical protein [Agreia bicolorata]SKA86963.1 hypothetical protein SAMN06295879_1011 [Agreia bicolorata]